MSRTTSALPHDRRPWIDALVLLGLWLACAALVNPRGDFPLNDDWSYGLSVKHLLDSGEFRPTGWTAMTLLSHTLWGALFASAGGFSFETLRLSTLLLGFIGLCAIHRFARGLGQPRSLALLLALTLAFNPVYYALSLSFMTDVPFTVWLMLAALCLCVHLQSGRWLPLLLGTALSVVAILTRQIGLAVPLAFAVCLPLFQGLRGPVLGRALLPLAASMASLTGFEQWLEAAGRLPALYSASSAALFSQLNHPLQWLGTLWVPLCAIGAYFGLFALPVLPVLLLRLRTQPGRAAVLVLIFLALLASTLWGLWMPMGGNILARNGIGPLTLKDTYIIGLNNVTSLPLMFWQVVTVASLVSAAVLMAAILLASVAACRRLLAKAPEAGDVPGLFLLVCALCSLGPVLLVGWFDRYLLPILPLLLLGLFALLPTPAPRASCRYTAHAAASLLLLGLAAYSVAATHDYFAWNRTRWQLLNSSTQQGMSAAQIDGGFEFNGLTGYDPGYIAIPGKSWWWVKDDRYVVTFALIPGYIPASVALYEKWLPPAQGTIFILQRPGP